MNKRIKIIIFILPFIALSLVFWPKKDSSYIRNDESLSFSMCPYSEQYKKWLELSEEEQALKLMPIMCDYSKVSNQFMEVASNLNPSDPRILLPQYDLRNDNGKNYVTSVKDQGALNGCWTFASMASLESHLLVKNNLSNTGVDLYNYSERHVEFATSYQFSDGINPLGFNRKIDTGGTILTGAAYLINHQGPVLENDMPYLNLTPLQKISLSEINKPIAADVNDLEFLFGDYDSCNVNQIKELKSRIVNFGAVHAGIYFRSDYYNNPAYYYNGLSIPNHAINIVGWDDNYSKNNFLFSKRPTIDGAWIVKNSYGNSFGQNGYFYVSYQDTNICSEVMSIRDVDLDVSDNHYFHDYLGWNGAFGNETPSGYGANVFIKKETSPELLKEITIGSTAPTDYEIFLNSVDGSLTGSNVKLIQSGNISFVGYSSIPLTTPVLLTGSEFAIIVRFTTPGFGYPVPVQSNQAQFYENATIDYGRSYVSNSISGPWKDVKLITGQPIVSIKAETDNIIPTTVKIVDGYVIEKYGTISDLLSRLNTNPENVYSVYSQDGTTNLTTGLVQTKLIIKNNDTIVYRVVVMGDLNSDGEADIADIIKISRHIIGIDQINDNDLYKAGDVNNDGDVDIGDIIKISRYILKEAEL